jgi:hypothetical protein
LQIKNYGPCEEKVGSTIIMGEIKGLEQHTKVMAKNDEYK